MITLAIDTSTARGSVALLDGSALLFDEHFSADRRHSASLFTTLARVRDLAPRADRIAVGLGPGSYAGIRIAIAAALGLESALRATLVGLPSVAALETDAPRYIAIGDARRETFYWTEVEAGCCVEGPLLVSAAELRTRLAAATLPVFTSEALPAFPEAALALPSARLLARLAATGRGITATRDLEPLYLREPHITAPKPRSAGK